MSILKRWYTLNFHDDGNDQEIFKEKVVSGSGYRCMDNIRYGREESLCTVTSEEGEERVRLSSIPGSKAMCVVAPESMDHTPMITRVATLFRAAMSAEQFHVRVSV